MKTHEDKARQVTPEAANAGESAVEQALAYRRRGWTVIDLPRGQKKPGRSGWQFERHDEEELRARFGNGPRNVGMLLGAVSDNTIDADQDHPLWAQHADRFLPATNSRFGRDSKPGGHRFYRCDSMPKSEKFIDPMPKEQGGMGTIGELRSSSSILTVLPGSLHDSGELIRWVEDGERADVDGAELRASYARGCAVMLLRHHWPGGGRHDGALHLAGGLLRADWSEEEVLDLVEWLCADTVSTSRELPNVVKDTARKLGDGEPVTGWPSLAEFVPEQVLAKVRKWLGIVSASDRRALTDFGNAERFIEQHGENLRYCPTARGWYVWDGRRWKEDTSGTAQELGKQTIRSIPEEGRGELDGERYKNILKWAVSSEQGRRLDTMLDRARTDPAVVTEIAEFDTNIWLLNVANGTLDLHKQELREHQRGDLITKLLPVSYDPTATCPTWDAFLLRAMDGRAHLVSYLQRLVGYCLTGDVGEKMLPMLWGRGDTGKTTFTETILALLGDDYATTTPESTIASQREGFAPPTNDLAKLRGSRFVLVSETTEGIALNEGRIKALTGRNATPARLLYKEWFTFVPEFKLFIETNHQPRIKGTGDAMWNRVKLVPFEVVIPVSEQDRRLPEKFRKELPGILAWAVAGCAAWQRDGMAEPDEVRMATATYRDESDLIADFLTELCVIEEGTRVRSGDLYRAYATWVTETRGGQPMSDQDFTLTLKGRGFRKEPKVKGYATWFGLGLQPVTLLPEVDTRVLPPALTAFTLSGG